MGGILVFAFRNGLSLHRPMRDDIRSAYRGVGNAQAHGGICFWHRHAIKPAEKGAAIHTYAESAATFLSRFSSQENVRQDVAAI